MFLRSQPAQAGGYRDDGVGEVEVMVLGIGFRFEDGPNDGNSQTWRKDPIRT